jgi:hypothetical protein
MKATLKTLTETQVINAHLFNTLHGEGGSVIADYLNSNQSTASAACADGRKLFDALPKYKQDIAVEVFQARFGK